MQARSGVEDKSVCLLSFPYGSDFSSSVVRASVLRLPPWLLWIRHLTRPLLCLTPYAKFFKLAEQGVTELTCQHRGQYDDVQGINQYFLH